MSGHCTYHNMSLQLREKTKETLQGLDFFFYCEDTKLKILQENISISNNVFYGQFKSDVLEV